PWGRWRSVAAPSAISVCCSPVRVWYAFTEMAILLIIAVTSVAASQRGLLVSRAIVRVNSVLFASSRDANFSTIPWRTVNGCFAHAGNARRAAWQACSTCPALASLPFQSTSLPTGLVFTRCSPSPVTQSPLIHKVMLFSPQGRVAPGEPYRRHYISGHPVLQPSALDVHISGWYAPAWRGSWCNFRSPPGTPASHPARADLQRRQPVGFYGSRARGRCRTPALAHRQRCRHSYGSGSLLSPAPRGQAQFADGLRQSPPVLPGLRNGYR